MNPLKIGNVICVRSGRVEVRPRDEQRTFGRRNDRQKRDRQTPVLRRVTGDSVNIEMRKAHGWSPVGFFSRE